MDKIIFTIPDWVMYIFGIWVLLHTVESVLNIYLFYLQRKLEHIKRTTSTTSVDIDIKE